VCICTSSGAAHELRRASNADRRPSQVLRSGVRDRLLSNERYLAGLASYLDVLQAQQQLFPAENTLAQTRFNRLANFAQFYKALGGG
jgi:outer membrane protein TolC